MENVQVWDNYFGSSKSSAKCPISNCSNILYRSQHCNGESNHTNHGVWEEDHKYPSSKGGSDRLSNKRPLCCECNREKSDSTSSKWR